MQDILLAKLDHDPDIIDLTVGEPHVVRDALFSVLGPNVVHVNPDTSGFWEYQKPNGYAPLVELLEAKHPDSKVVVTNGAKQGLAAFFYAMQKMNRPNVGMKLPYWALVPPLARALGCNPTFVEPHQIDSCDSYLLLAPNNPDGQCPTSEDMQTLAREAARSGRIFAHDAAYYTHSYLPKDHELLEVGDLQIWSASKMLGLSSLRIGYITCRNDDVYKLACEYMETFTVGASVLSQACFHRVISEFEKNASVRLKFEEECRRSLLKGREIAATFNPAILKSVPSHGEGSFVPGMFGWFKVLDERAFAQTNIRGIDGAAFGMPGYIRLNLATGERSLTEASDRLAMIKL